MPQLHQGPRGDKINLSTTTATAKSVPPATTSARNSRHTTTSVSTSDNSEGHADPAFEGESSLAAHAGFASRFVEEAVQSTPETAFGGEIDETLSALRQLVGAQAQYSSASVELPVVQARNDRDGKRRPMPPVQIVMSCLSVARQRVDVQAFWMSGFMTFERFVQTTVDVYFGPGINDAQYLIVTIGLYWLIMSMRALSHDEPWPGIDEDELAEACEVCRSNAESCLADLPYHLPNTLDYVIALSFAGGHALEMSRPSLAWSLLTSAIHICQNLGIHRASILDKEKPAIKDLKYRLFWGLYVLEKSLALRLGRASVLQDCDISLSRPDKREDGDKPWDGDGPWHICMAYTCEMASIQGRVYTQLYSPGALLEEDSTRASRALDLASDILKLSGSQPHERVPDSVKRHLSAELFDPDGLDQYRKSPLGAVEEAITSTNISSEYLVDCLQVQQLCVLTLVYRAMPVPKGSSSAFTQDCIDTARESLALHQKIIGAIPASNTNMIDMYFSWTILAVPFAPFIVIFCHIIESTTRNNGAYRRDLKQLEDFTLSLDKGGGRLSGATGRLQKLCQVLFKVARKYADLKESAASTTSQAHHAQAQTSQSQQREFDTYIQALGLFGNMPMATDSVVGVFDDGGCDKQSTATTMHGSQTQYQQANGMYDMPNQIIQYQHEHQQQYQQDSHMQQELQQEQQQQQGAILGDWFYGGQQMLGILEQPTFDFEL